MQQLMPFEPLTSCLDSPFIGERIGIALYIEGGKPLGTLADIVEHCPIRLLAGTEFIFISTPDTSRQSYLSHLLRYRDFSNEAKDADGNAQIISRLDCLVTNSYIHARIAFLLGIPVWFYSTGDSRQEELQRLKNQWIKLVSVVSGHCDNVGRALFRKLFLFRLLNPGSYTFEAFSGDFSVSTADGPVTFTSPAIESPDDLDLLLRLPLFPFTNITVETTSICNLRCDYCPNSKYERDKAFMPESSFYHIIESIYDYHSDYSGTISPHLYGEPLLDSRLEDFIRYCKHRFPGTRLELFTNGYFLDRARFIALKNAGVDLFRISQHEAVPPPGLCETLAEIKSDDPGLYTVEYNHEYLAEHKMNRGGLVDVPTLPMPDQYFARCVTYRDLTVDVHGNVLLCCNDYFGRHIFGNINTMSIQTIWESPEYCEVRNQLFFGLLPLPICQKCLIIIKT